MRGSVIAFVRMSFQWLLFCRLFGYIRYNYYFLLLRLFSIFFFSSSSSLLLTIIGISRIIIIIIINPDVKVVNILKFPLVKNSPGIIVLFK